MCILGKPLAILVRIGLAVVLMPVILVASSDKQEQLTEETKSKKTIEIQSSEKLTMLNRNVIDVAFPDLDIDPRTGALRRSFLKEARTIVDRKGITEVCARQNATGTPGNKEKDR